MKIAVFAAMAVFMLGTAAQAAPEAPGFVIVSVHIPELPEERSISNVRTAVAEQSITNPVMVDGDYSYRKAMSNEFRIAARAIGEMHVGQARAAELEQAIEQALAADAS